MTVPRAGSVLFRPGGVLRVATALLLLACGDTSPGRRAYVDSGCARCHASDLSGTTLGPSLEGMDRFWDQATLRAFLADPDSFRTRDPRLRRVAEQYPAPMPTFMMPDTLRSQIARYLVSVEK